MLTTLVHSPVARALSWALIHFLWEGAAVAALLASALLVFRPASARVRYGLACVALCALLAAPVATLGLLWPRSHTGAGVAMRSGARPADPLRPVATPNPPPALPPDPLAWVAPFWMAGVLIFYLRTAASWAAAERLRRRGTIPATADWQDRLRALARRLRVSRPIVMLESCLADTPAVVGFLRPAILIPAGLLTGLTPEQVEAILLHELAHIRRHDYAVNVLQTLVEGLLFYHPAVWWVSGVIRAERENCCDDAVVAALGDARGYAAALAELEWRRSVGQPALAAKGGNLMRRIHRLLEPERPRSVAGPVFGAALLMASIAAGLLAWHPPAARAARASQEAQPRAQLETPYEKWLAEDVVYIIAPEEQAAFRRLQTNQEREQFIEQFWLRRDPTPGTVENEFKQEHYRRIAYANEHFAEAIPGWKTHRGMYYIKFGPPNEIDDHRDSRPLFVAWTYHNIQPAPGVSAGEMTVVFTDVDANGQFLLPRHTSGNAAIMGTSASPPRVAILNQTASITFDVPSFGGPTAVYIRIETRSGGTAAVAREEASAPRYTKSFQLPPGAYRIQVFVQRPGEGVITLFPGGQEFDIPGPAPAGGAANLAPASRAPSDLDNSIRAVEINLAALREVYVENQPLVVRAQAQLRVLQAERERAQGQSAAPRYDDDRGGVYGVLGPPDEIATAGDGQSWIYRHVEGAGDQVTFRLTNLAGSGRLILAAAPTAGGNANQSGLLDLAKRVKAYGANLGSSSSSDLDVKVEIRPRDSSGASDHVAVISVPTPRAGGTFAIFGRITTMTRRLVNVFEETVDAAPGQAPYQRTIPLAAGRYRLDVIVKDVTSGSVTDREMAIEVPAPEARYVIGARDTLSVMVDGEKGYSGRYLVRPDGRISMPSLGEVPAAGRTPEELRQDLAERLAAWVKAPQVSVAVAAVHGK